jgi:hypothetical protein
MAAITDSNVIIRAQRVTRMVRGLAKPFTLEPQVAAVAVDPDNRVYSLFISVYLPDYLEAPMLDEDLSFIGPVNTDANELDVRYVYLRIQPWDINAHHHYSLWTVYIEYQLEPESPEAEAVLVLFSYDGPQTPETPRGTVTTVKRTTQTEA